MKIYRIAQNKEELKEELNNRLFELWTALGDMSTTDPNAANINFAGEIMKEIDEIHDVLNPPTPKTPYQPKTTYCENCGGEKVWCEGCEMWSRTCCEEFGTCMCS